MDFKKISIKGAFVATSFFFVGNASATGIPVYCFNCEMGSYNAAHSIIDSVRMQTEALLNAQDYAMRTGQKLDTAREVALGKTEQKIKNGYAMDPALGAKPRSACGQLGAASLYSAASSSSAALLSAINKRTQAHNEQGRSLAPAEPRRDFSVHQVIETLDDKKNPVEAGKIILGNEPIDPENKTLVGLLTRLKDILMNPFPIEYPSEESVERIKKSGSSGEKLALAQSLAMQKRMEVGQHLINEDFEKKIQRLDTSGIKYLMDEIKPMLSKEEQGKLGERISPKQLDELMSTYRVRSEEWIKTALSSPSAEMVQREQMLMQAEMLRQLWEIKVALENSVKLQAFSDVRETSQAGFQHR